MCSIRAVSIVQSAVSIESQMPDEQYPCSIRVQYPEVSTLFVSSIRAVSCSILQYPAQACASSILVSPTLSRNVCLTFVASLVGVSSVGVSLVGGVQPRGNMSSDGVQPEFHSLSLVKCLVRFND